MMDRGYCYLRLFAAYNDSVRENVFDLNRMREILGRYPLVRRVVGFLVSYVTVDFYIPRVRAISSVMYHVFPREEVLLFSEVVGVLLFSRARIVDNDDTVVRTNQSVAAFVQLCDAGGLNVNDALAEASRKQWLK